MATQQATIARCPNAHIPTHYQYPSILRRSSPLSEAEEEADAAAEAAAVPAAAIVSSYETISPPRKPNHANPTKTHHMINHRDKKIKKQLPAALHLHLHRAAALERVAAPDDHRQVMRAQPRLGVGGVGVCEARAGEDRAALDAAVEALLAESETLEWLQGVFLRGAASAC